jgi:hypothetical protein
MLIERLEEDGYRERIGDVLRTSRPQPSTRSSWHENHLLTMR